MRTLESGPYKGKKKARGRSKLRPYKNEESRKQAEAYATRAALAACFAEEFGGGEPD